MTDGRRSRPAGLWEKEFLGLLPDPGTAGPDQAAECLLRLRDALGARGLPPSAVVKLAWFVRAGGPADLERREREAAAALRKVLPDAAPAAGVIAEPPGAGREAALEAVILRRPSRRLEIVPKAHRGLRYVLLRAADGIEVLAGGIAGPRSGDRALRIERAFARAAGLLAREGLSFRDVVRQWNYVQDITGVSGRGGRARQNYQIFNNIRARAYARAGLGSAYPAATGIGAGAGGFVLEFVAAAGSAARRTYAVSNPRQVDAHRYSADVLVGASGRSAKQTPKFERAKVVLAAGSATCYVSGTAAIIGQEAVGRGDAAGQTRATVETIERLVDPANLRRAGVPAASIGRRFAYVRTYVKRDEDVPAVEEIVRASFGGAPSLFLVADVCREDLLVEIEGAVEVRTA